MTSLAQIDPFLYGYFSDETLEHGERVGLALLHAAHHLEIGFSPQMLPEITPAAPSGRPWRTAACPRSAGRCTGAWRRRTAGARPKRTRR